MKLITSFLSQKSFLLLALTAVTMLFSGCYVEEDRRVVRHGYYDRPGYYDRGGYDRGYNRGYRSDTVVRENNVYVAPRRNVYVNRTPSRGVVVNRTNVVNRRNVIVTKDRRHGDRDDDRRRD